jgi:hypothetical protein
MLTVRRANESDTERLVALHEAVAPLHYDGDWGRPAWMREEVGISFRRLAAGEEMACFVAENGGVVLGYATCVVVAHPLEGVIGELHQPVVSGGCDAEEAGRLLVEEAVRFCRARKARTVRAVVPTPTFLGLDDERDPAAFWDRIGWRPALRTFEPVDPEREGQDPPHVVLVGLLLAQAVHQDLRAFELAESKGGVVVRRDAQQEVPVEQFLGNLRSYQRQLKGKQVDWPQVRQRLCRMADIGSERGHGTIRFTVGVFPPPRDKTDVVVSVAAAEQGVLRLHLEAVMDTATTR